MRHHSSTNHRSRNAPHARSLVRNLAASLLTHQQITTTMANAKAAQPFVERLITLGKTGDLHARRRAIALLGSSTAAGRLFKDISPLFQSRRGGYTRIIRLGHRRGDGAMLALLELTERIVVTPPAVEKTSSRKAKARPSTTEAASESPTAPKGASAPAPTAAPPNAPQKPRRLFDGLRKIWGRRQSGDRG